MSKFVKAVAIVIAAILVVIVFDAANTSGGNRKVMTNRVMIEGEEQVRSYVCKDNAIVFSVEKKGCFDVSTGEYLGDFWEINPQLAERVPEFLK